MPLAGDRNGSVCGDGALVERCRRGDWTAFTGLVDRYFGMVVRLAERILGDRDDALDACQEVFLAAYKKISELEHPDGFGAWLGRIAHNEALMRIRRRRHTPTVVRLGRATVLWEEARRRVRNGSPSVAEEAERDDLRAQVRGQIEALATDYEAVIRLFYLDGMDLRSIAGSLGVPVGTVKWRLSEARNLLRKELLMSELTDDLRHRETTKPLLEIKNIWGSGSPPWRAVETLLAQQVLFCVRKRALTPEEVAREVKADVRYVREHLDRMAQAEVVQARDGMFQANCILFDADDVAVLKREMGARGRETARVIGKHAPALSRVLAQVSPAEQGFEEGYLRWIALPTMVLNFGVRGRLQETKGVVVKPPLRPDGGRWYYKPHVIEVALPVELGCNSYYFGGECSGAQYWNTDIGVKITRPSAVDLAVVRRLARGPLKVASLVDVLMEEPVAGLIERGLARREGETLVSTVPVFTPADGDILQPVLDGIIDEVLDKVYAEYPQDVYAVLDSLGFSFIRSDYPADAQELAQLGAVRALVEADVLPQPPSPAPPGWGFFAWTGVFAPMARE